MLFRTLFRQGICGFFQGQIRHNITIFLFSLIFLHAFASLSPLLAQQAPVAASAGDKTPPALAETLFDDWTLRCLPQPVGAASGACELAQSVTASLGGKTVPVLEMAVSPAADKVGKAKFALVVLTPLDVLLSADFGLQTGKAKPQLFRFRNCNHLGCFAVVPLTRDHLKALVASRDAAVFFRLLDGQTVKVMVSLKGFGRAMDALTAKAAAK